MELLKKLLNNRETNILSTRIEPSYVTACANCWGNQEYGDCYMELGENQTKKRASYSSSLRKNFVMQFVETYITGIGR